MSPTPTCWFAQLPDAGPCEGRLVRCHLLPRQVIKRESTGGRRADGRPGAAPRARMIFRQITHDDLGCASYLIGDASSCRSR